MKITADTNLLVRAVTGDDQHQAAVARKTLAEATSVAVGTVTLCELVWVLIRGYKEEPLAVAKMIRQLLDVENLVTERNAALAGLQILEQGGDFADGVIAHEGQWLGGELFTSFDKQAVKQLTAIGVNARLLA